MSPQPDDAKTRVPLDVGEVAGTGFAPQGPSAGRLTVGRFVLTR